MRVGSPLDAKPATAPLPLRRNVLPVSEVPVGHARVLTPQFHWNLNQTARQCLSTDELEALYQLFLFYDSSYQGDLQPAIHCDRFIEVLRDAQLLADDENEEEELQIATVEKVFAQAVLGMLRSYLDAETQPALPFEPFSGALFHCAMLKFPDVSPPQDAFMRVIRALLTLEPRRHAAILRGGLKGLVQHAEQAAISNWSVQDLHKHLLPVAKQEESLVPSDFLQKEVYQKVLQSLCVDKQAEQRRQQRLQEMYEIPDEIKSHLSSETIRYVSERFKTYDVFDRGVLPREEVYALLSSMAKRLEIVDVYELLAVILAGGLGDRKQMPLGSLVLTAPSKVKEISLVQILDAIYACRRARTASYQQQIHQEKQRKAAAAAANTTPRATHGADNSAEKTDHEVSNRVGKAEGGGNACSRKEKRQGRGKGGGKGGAKGQNAIVHRQTSKRILCNSNAADVRKRDKQKTMKTSKTETGDAAMLRRLSRMSASSSDASGSTMGGIQLSIREVIDGGESTELIRQDSTRSMKSVSSSTSTRTSVRVPPIGFNQPPTVKITPAAVEIRAAAHRIAAEDDESARPENEASQGPQAALIVRMYHTTEPEPSTLDGCVCCTLELVLSRSPACIVVSQGVYFQTNGDRFEVWDAKTITMDERLPPVAAVQQLRHIIEEKEREGFRLVPEEQQRDALEALLQAIRDARCPRYAVALHMPRTHRTADPRGPVHDEAQHYDYGFRRGGMLLRSSLERGSTFVRQRSASDLLAIVSDSMLHKHLKLKKRQSILTSSVPHSLNQSGSESRCSTPDQSTRTVQQNFSSLNGSVREQPIGVEQLMAKWGLQLSEPFAWVDALNAHSPEQHQATLHSSRSVPSLKRPMKAGRLLPLRLP